jgi:outer membrane lipoprotein SlyB
VSEIAAAEMSVTADQDVELSVADGQRVELTVEEDEWVTAVEAQQAEEAKAALAAERVQRAADLKWLEEDPEHRRLI